MRRRFSAATRYKASVTLYKPETIVRQVCCNFTNLHKGSLNQRKLGFAGVYLFLMKNIDCERIIYLIYFFTTEKNPCILHGRVFEIICTRIHACQLY